MCIYYQYIHKLISVFMALASFTSNVNLIFLCNCFIFTRNIFEYSNSSSKHLKCMRLAALAIGCNHQKAVILFGPYLRYICTKKSDIMIWSTKCLLEGCIHTYIQDSCKLQPIISIMLKSEKGN